MKVIIRQQIIYVALTILSVVAAASTFAQNKTSKEDKKLKKEADYYFGFKDYKGALAIYEKLLERQDCPPELSYRTGKCILETIKDKKTASVYFEMAGEGGYKEAYFHLAQWYHTQEEFDKARDYYKKYDEIKWKKRVHKEPMAHYLQSCATAKNMTDNPVKVTIENMGQSVNSEYSEYVPVISMDEASMIFTSRRPGSTGGKLDPYGLYYEDIYISKQENKHWSRPEVIGSNINTESHDASVGLSADGFTLITYKTNEEGSGGDLYWSSLIGEAWQAPAKFPVGINSAYFEPSASFSPDMKELYFSSNRPGGLGGLDIYNVKRLPNGDWGLPTNLGPAINTAFDDDAPFIHPDNVTLYFSSKGHETMGGYDIFRTSKKYDGSWGETQNLGYPINTTDDDTYFVLSADGRRGYLSSARKGGYGEQDLYVVHLTDDVGDLTIIKGIVSIAVNDSTSIPQGAVISVIELETRRLQGIYRSNSSTGKYLIVIPPGKKYQMEVAVEGYEPVTRDWYFDEDAGFNIVHKPIKVTNRIEETNQDAE